VFPLPYEQPIAGILYLLFALEVTLLVGGLWFGRLNEEGTGRLPRWLRVLLSASLVIAAFLGWQGSAQLGAVQSYAALVFWGMAAGLIGDLIMARLIPVPQRLVFGMIAFGVGHLLYARALYHLVGLWSLREAGKPMAILLLTLGFCAWAWYTQVRKPGGSKVLNLGSLAYGWLIGTVVALAIWVALQDARFVPLALGALLFLASDFVLGNWVIRGHVWRSVNDVIWVTYVCGQLLIVYSVAPVWRAWSA
jgi:hypothetical protein